MSAKISAAILARNEENNIRYCLATLKWCDEIVVVDMESEDRTIEIARQYTDKIYSHPKVLAFDIGKKFAVEKTTGDWILIIDADEMVPPLVAHTLKEIADKDSADIVYIPFKTYIMGVWIKHTMWWPEYHSRFFKRGAISLIETVHAYMNIPESARKLYLPATEQNAIHHFAYRDSEHFIQKLNRYTSIEAQHLYDKGTKFSLCRMFWASIHEFSLRYFLMKGFRDGYHGFFLSIMMSFYRALTYIKLWEKWQYRDESVNAKYDRLRNRIIRPDSLKTPEDGHE